MDEAAIETARRRAAAAVLRPDRRHALDARPAGGAGAPAPGAGRRRPVLRLRLEPGFRRFLARDRVRQRRRPWSAGPRLLPKTDAKSAEIRTKYVAHIGKMFELLGEGADAGAPVRRQGDADRNRAGQGHAVARRQARSVQAVPQDERQGPAGARRRLRLAGLPGRAGRAEAGHLQRDRAGVLQGARQAVARQRPRRHQDLPALARRARHAPALSSAFDNEHFDFFSQHAARREGAAAALEALRHAGRRPAGRSAGPGIRQPRVQPGAEGEGAAHDAPGRAGDGEGHRIAGLDEPGDQGARAGKAAHASSTRSAIPTSGATTVRTRSSRTISSATSSAATCSKRAASWPRSASRSTARSGA